MRLILLVNRSLVHFRYANRWIHLSERDEKEKEKAERVSCPVPLDGDAPGKIRTCDFLIRSQALYPTELRVRV